MKPKSPLTYRVVQMENGWFKTQYRWFFWWFDSAHAPSADREDQVNFAMPCRMAVLRASKVSKVVWP